jgi:hypothetical protein
VPTPPEGNKLADKQYATLILRLVLDRQGRLLYGELVDVAGGPPQRFAGWRGLIRAVQVWLTSQTEAGASEEL